MTDDDLDTPMRMAAFEHLRKLGEIHDNLTANELKPGFVFQGERIPLINPQRGIFKPKQIRFLLSIKTVFPKPGDAHRQIFEGDETIDYAFMGGNPGAAAQKCSPTSSAESIGSERRPSQHDDTIVPHA